MLPCDPGGDAEYVYFERLGIAEGLGMETGPGSEAELVALREARRAAAGVPDRLRRSRDTDLIDQVLAAFSPFGGLTFRVTSTEGATS